MPPISQYKPGKLTSGSSEDYEHIEDALGLTEPDQFLRNNIDTCYELNLEILARESPTRTSGIRRVLEEIKENANRLASTLSESPAYDAETALAFMVRQDEALGDIIGRIPMDPFQMKRLADAAQRALNSLPKDRGGRPRNVPLQEFIICLAQLYENKTGKEAGVSWGEGAQGAAYSGPFFRFVDACLERLAPQYRKGNEALGQFIRRALNERCARRQ